MRWFKGVILIGLLSLFIVVKAQVNAFVIITPETVGQLDVVRQFEMSSHPTQIAFNPVDSTQLAVAQESGQVSILNLTTQQETKTLWLQATFVVSMEYSVDGERLIAVLKNGTTLIWDTNDWTEIHTLSIEGQTAQMLDVAEGDLLAITYTDGPARLWNSKTGEMLVQIQSHATGVMGMDLNPDGTALALGYAWGAIAVFNLVDIETGDISLGFYHRTGELNDVALRPASEYQQDQYEIGVVSISNFTGLEIWYSVYDIDDYDPPIDMAYPDFVTFNSDGRLIAVSGKETASGGGCEATPYNLCHVEILYREYRGPLYTDMSSEIVADIDIRRNLLTDMNFSADDRFFATASYDDMITIWGIPQP